MKPLSKNQAELLKMVRQAQYDRKSLIDLDEIMDLASWKPTKESIQFTIRTLISREYIQKTGLQNRRGRRRVCFKLAKEGEIVFDPRLAFPVVTPEKGIETGTEKFSETEDISIPVLSDELNELLNF